MNARLSNRTEKNVEKQLQYQVLTLIKLLELLLPMLFSS